MKFLFYYEDVPSIHYTGIIHRGVCVVGIDWRWLPVEDRAIGLVFWNHWIGWCHE